MLLGYKKQFTGPIQIGTKVFTLRKRRKVQPKIGERLYMYSDLRTNRTALISDKETLQSIQSVRLTIQKIAFMPDFEIHIWVDGRELNTEEKETVCTLRRFYQPTYMGQCTGLTESCVQGR